jgi:L-2-hydroxyglutarate oxidase LhgO
MMFFAVVTITHEYVNLPRETTDLRPTADFVIIGAGVCGLTTALALRRRLPSSVITVLEREPEVGRHASGRNSGVLHAGIYYDSSSLKARFCREGSLRMQEFCREHGLPLLPAGKVIVPAGGASGEDLLRLKAQADANGVVTQLIDRRQLAELEPECAPFGQALYSPSTATVDPKAVLQQLVRSVGAAGINLVLSSQISEIDVERRRIITGNGAVGYGCLINCAGAGSLALARKFGLAVSLMMMPFRGSYYELKRNCVRGNIYPVPDPRFPFLGVHVSRSVNGRVYAGPTAWPVLSPGTLAILAGEYVTNRGGMRRHMHHELAALAAGHYLKKVRELVPGLQRADLIPRAKSGIRAQLYDTKQKKLVTDFMMERTRHSVHVLNMISPGFTCSFSFAEYLAEFIVSPSP